MRKSLRYNQNAINFKKKPISIQKIGKLRFWFGIISGVFSAFSIALFINHFRESYRYLTSFSSELIVFSEQEQNFYNLFVSTFSISLGFSLTVWIWLYKPFKGRMKIRFFKQLSNSIVLYFFWLSLMAFFTIGYSLATIYGLFGFNMNLNLSEEFKYLFILIPIVFFYQNWLILKLQYRIIKWFFYSLPVFLIITLSVNYVSSINPETLNNNYFKKYENEYNYIDLEVLNAKNNYGILLSEETIKTLKKKYSNESRKQIQKIKYSFSKNYKISLDTILLQKMIICNVKKKSRYYNYNSLYNWQYALPDDILKQIENYPRNQNEIKELFNILEEQIFLINFHLNNSDSTVLKNELDKRRYLVSKNYIPEVLIENLQSVLDSLSKNKKYQNYYKDLSPLKTKPN
ncbi:hypothetical protein [Aureivirga sp. CE67]|uniref:hypothetical protein n=1 Tax=Aureivirga sp. CE67 TaxID=1788983 RepID=UPI0018C9D997|nr:hypothetical protein [Aureivirga sp. CE67]